jgi:Predicted dehydrogenases and related proteins
VGGGFRARAFLRLAELLPERLVVSAVVTRDATRGAEIEARWGVPTVRDMADLARRERPDFVVTAVTGDANPGVVEDLVRLGIAVLSETPPAGDVAGLRRLWSRVGSGGLVQVAEQYAHQPMNAARLAVLRDGVIGVPTSAQVSMTQTYHAVSLLRAMLGVGFEAAEVRAVAFSAPLANPLSRAGWSGDATPVDLDTTIATIDFGDRVGLYDFTETQTRNPLRGSRVVARGSLGEIVDERVVRLMEPATALESFLVRRQTGQHRDFEVADLDHIGFDGAVVYRNVYYGARLSDEEIAMAAMLDAMGDWCRGEASPPYPLAAAAQDHLIGLAIGQSVKLGRRVTTRREAWAGT